MGEVLNAYNGRDKICIEIWPLEFLRPSLLIPADLYITPFLFRQKAL